MGRFKGSDFMPSQREAPEMRELRMQLSEEKRKHELTSQWCADAIANRTAADNKVAALEAELADIKVPSLDTRAASIKKMNTTSTDFYEHVDVIYRFLKRYDPADIAPLTVAALRKLQREVFTESNFFSELLAGSGFKAAREALLHEHDVKIAKHLGENVYTADHFSILRLVGNVSKRVCGLIEQSVKWVHHTNGLKSRQMLHPDSKVPAPSLFSVNAINAAEEAAAQASKLELNDHDDRKGADICGKAYALDRAMLDSLKQTTRAGGMATRGTKDDPHLICVTGDGAGLTARDSGVRVAHFVGSTNFLSQSSQDCVNWLFYKEACKAEDYTILAGRLNNVLPDLRRIYETGELCDDDGNVTGTFVKLVLVADKPFTRHVCGMLSHNANQFGAPMCECCDEDEDEDTGVAAPSIYNYTYDKRNHYGRTTFEDLCHRAHVAPWEALGKNEPTKWRFVCPCCHEVCTPALHTRATHTAAHC